MIQLFLQPRFYDAIRLGKKTVEGRLGKVEYLSIQKGHKIIFSKNKEPVPALLCNVHRVNHYATFAEMLAKEGLKNVLPGTPTIEEGMKIYRKFYSEAEENHYGVAAIHITVTQVVTDKKSFEQLKGKRT
ncbi:MAG: ASCH domain-containing protein [Parachlamydia sp.]|jgi:ASC-1-like (ASCH) protein|nr:ASCH domain-containing protein [Parachlamydia sp.]